MIGAGVYSRQLIGRSRELAFIMERAFSARGGCIVVRGEAGIGKSRLLSDVAEQLREGGIPVFVGWTREYANHPYAALTEALEGLELRHLPLADEARGGDGRAAWFAEVASALRSALSERPRGAVVVLEDLHWADIATVELIRFCAARLHGTQLLFVATYRVDEVESDSVRARAFAGLERDADVLTLQPLAPGQIEHLIKTILTRLGLQIPAETVSEIRDLADGRPLYAEELLRGVLERLERNERATPTVPPSIRATVRERFSSLDDVSREVLLSAAVVGHRFSATRVGRLSGVETETIYGALRKARELQLVIEDPADDDGDLFAFRHALTREAVYGEMLRAEAKLRHARVAADLIGEKSYDVAAIAEHAWRARAGEDAAAWNERAGDESAAFFAYAQAVRAYDRAFQSTSDEKLRARVSHRAADSAYALGDLESAARWYGDAASSFRAVGDRSLALRLALRRASVLFEAGRLDDALAEAENIEVPDEDHASRFEVDTRLGGLLLVHGRAPEAMNFLERAKATLSQRDGAVSALFSATYALALHVLGKAREAREHFEEAVAAAKKSGDDDLLLRTYNNWGNHEINNGQLSKAQELYRQMFAVADSVKNVRHRVLFTQNATVAALLGGDIRSADELLRGLDSIEHGIVDVHRRAAALRLRLATLRGEADEHASTRAAQALEEASSAGHHLAAAILAAALAYHAAAAGEIDAASRFVASAATAIPHCDAPFWLLDAASRYGDVDARVTAQRRLKELAEREDAWAARGFLALAEAREAVRHRRRDAAQRFSDSAVEAFGTAGWRLEQAFALTAAGRVADAIAVFREMGAVGEVRRLTASANGKRKRGEATLTPREREVASLLVAGRTARAIADALVISERTVETHVAAVYRKLGVSSRRELASLLGESTPIA